MIRHSLKTFALVAILTPTMVFAQSSFDVATKTDGAYIKGNLARMTKNEIVIDRSGIDTSIPVNELKELNFAREPIGFRSIRRLIENGNYEEALEKIKAFDKASLPRAVMVTELDYMETLCKAELAMTGTPQAKQAAVSTIIAFVRKNPENYHFYHSMELLGNLYAASGDFKNAETSYTELAKSGWADYKLRAALLTGEMLLLQNEYATAEKRFDLVIKNTRSGDPVGNRQKLMATLNKAQCMAASNRGAEALKMVDKVIAENDPADSPLFAKAYLTQGACHLKANKAKEAALAYLHVDVLYFNQPTAHAEALYHLSKIWTKLNKPQRSIQARQTLKSRYSGTSWAQRP